MPSKTTDATHADARKARARPGQVIENIYDKVYVDRAFENASVGGSKLVALDKISSGAGMIPSANLPVTSTVNARLLDENDVAYGVKHINNKPRVSSMPYLYDIAEGNVADHGIIRAYGHNADVAAAWETVYNESDLKVYLTSAERLQVASTDAEDDAVGGDGARTLTIAGLDSNYDALSETVDMDGLVNVLTDASFLRVLSLTVVTAGDTGYNEGTITVSNNADSAVLDSMGPQENGSLSASYTIENGHTGYITQAMATESSGKGCEFGFWIRTFGGLWIIKRTIVLLNSSLVLTMTIPMKLPQKTDIEIRAKAVLAGANVTAGIEGWIESN